MTCTNARATVIVGLPLPAVRVFPSFQVGAVREVYAVTGLSFGRRGGEIAVFHDEGAFMLRGRFLHPRVSQQLRYRFSG